MAQDGDTQIKLENFDMNIANTVELAKELKEKQIGEFKDLEFEETAEKTKGEIQDTAKEAIESLDEEKLTSFIEKSLKVGDNGSEWLIYSDMRKNPFYPFMVQASIDLLSDKLKDDESGTENKYNNDGELDMENGRTLDEYISDYRGIDNIYGPGTRKVVTMVQKILKIKDDGLAGPQFFAKICSVLNNKEVSDFKVHGYDDEHPYPYGFEKSEKKDPEGRTKTDEKIDDNYTKYTITDLGNLVNKEKFPENSCVVYENDDVNYIFYNDGNVKDVKANKIGDWLIDDGNVKVKRDSAGDYTLISEKAVDEKVDEKAVVEEINKNVPSGNFEELWDNLYKAYIPNDGVSLNPVTSVNGQDNTYYEIKYKNMTLGTITYKDSLAMVNVYDDSGLTGSLNNGKSVDNSDKIIGLKWLDQTTIEYYKQNFLLDHGLSAKVEDDLLKFYDASGKYTNRYISFDANGIVCNKDGDNMCALSDSRNNSGNDIEITPDPKDSTKYYANRKEATGS